MHEFKSLSAIVKNRGHCRRHKSRSEMTLTKCSGDLGVSENDSPEDSPGGGGKGGDIGGLRSITCFKTCSFHSCQTRLLKRPLLCLHYRNTRNILLY